MIREYVTRQGDTWDIIAYRVYEDEMVMHELMKANPSLILKSVFPAGVKVRLPEIDDEKRSENLPPWMR